MIQKIKEFSRDPEHIPIVHCFLGVVYEYALAAHLNKTLRLGMSLSKLFGEGQEPPSWLFLGHLVLIPPFGISANMHESSNGGRIALNSLIFPPFWIYLDHVMECVTKGKSPERPLPTLRVLKRMENVNINFLEKFKSGETPLHLGSHPATAIKEKTLHLVIEMSPHFLETLGRFEKNPISYICEEIKECGANPVVHIAGEAKAGTPLRRRGLKHLEELKEAERGVDMKAVVEKLIRKGVSPETIVPFGKRMLFDEGFVSYEGLPLISWGEVSQDLLMDIHQWLLEQSGLEILGEHLNIYVKTTSKQDPPPDPGIGGLRKELLGKAYIPVLLNLEFKPLREVESYIGSILSTPLPSFFMEDLERIEDEMEHSEDYPEIRSFIFGLPRERKKALEDNLNHILSIKNLPPGRWPSPEHTKPFLNQQLAVMKFYSDFILGGMDNIIISVNGPPGSGKTTLLRDIIAAAVTERARILAELYWKRKGLKKRNPLALFKGGARKDIPEDLALKLIRMGAVVVSANNNSVENISLELPRIDAVKGAEKEVEIFLEKSPFFKRWRELASNYLQDHAWGLISAALGRMSNIKRFLETLDQILELLKNLHKAFLERKKGEEPKDVYGRMIEDLLDGIYLFSYLLEGKANLEKLGLEEKVLEELPPSLKEVKEALEVAKIRELKLIQVELLELLELDEELKKRKERLRDIQRALERARELIKRPGDKIRFIRRRHELKEEKEKLEGWIQNLRVKKEKLNREILRLLQEAGEKSLRDMVEKAPYRRALEEIQKIVKERRREVLKKAELLSEYELDQYLHNLTPIPDHVKDQHRTPFGIRTLEILRKLIFLNAIKVHWLFLAANYPYVRDALNAWRRMVLKRPGPKESPAFSPLTLWTCLSLCIPVVSTTYHSFSSLFGGLPRNSLGIIISDESGQSVPHMAVGALWRGRCFVAVGDPLQLEPVVPTPGWVKKLLIRASGIEKAIPKEELGLYIPGECKALRISPNFFLDTSVQVLADRACETYDTIEVVEGFKVEVGIPLRVHFRCSRPIFDMANRLAYGGKMVLFKEKERVPGCAIWLDTGPVENRMNVSPKEASLALKLAKNSLDMGRISHFILGKLGMDSWFELKHIYILSPFKDLYEALWKVWRMGFDYESWIKWQDSNVGTVHTFQGKEAELVILVMGGRNYRAKRWAIERPNLLNVALTRAKRAVVFIGDLQRWREVARDKFKEIIEPHLDRIFTLGCRWD